MLEIFLIFLRLGLTSFGGPVAHLSFFRTEFVARRQWISDSAYADLVALCQFLPGPASSQVGMAIGLSRGGILGAFMAWFGFTLPSAIILVAFAYGVTALNLSSDVLHGLKVAAVAVVAHAVWAMGKQMCSTLSRKLLALASAGIFLWWPHTITQMGLIIATGVFAYFAFTSITVTDRRPLPLQTNRKISLLALGIFVTLLFALPLLRFNSVSFALFDIFYRTGAMVFGGGHVVLPLLQTELVTPGFIDAPTFMAGYGAAQAVPGPLFTLSAYLGAAINTDLPPIVASAICLDAIFLPSFLLIIGIVPFWEKVRSNNGLQRAMQGVNAAVVGLLLAALYHPVWTSAIFNIMDIVCALIALTLLILRTPSWAVVILTAVPYVFI